MTEFSGQGRILWTLSLSLCICMLGMGVVNPLLPLYAGQMGASDAFLGVIVGAFSVSRMAATLFSGWIADRLQRRRLILCGITIYGLASLGYVFANQAWHLLLVRLFNGVGSAFVIPIAMAIGAEVAPKGHEGRYFGVMQMATFLGIGFGPLMSGLMVQHWGMKAPFLMMTSMSVLAFLGVLVNVPPGVGDGAHESVNLLGNLWGIVKDRVLKRVLIYQTFTALGRGSMLLLLPLLSADFHLSVAQVGYILSGVSISSAVLQRTSGLLADRFPKRYLTMASCCLSFLALVCLPLPKTFGGLMAVGLFYGGANAIGTPATLAMVTERSLLYGSGASMGAYNIAFGLGFSAGSVIAGAFHHAGATTLGLWCVALPLAAVSLLFRLKSLGQTLPAPREG